MSLLLWVIFGTAFPFSAGHLAKTGDHEHDTQQETPESFGDQLFDGGEECRVFSVRSEEKGSEFKVAKVSEQTLLSPFQARESS